MKTRSAGPRVLHPVGGPDRDVDGRAFGEVDDVAVEGHAGRALDHHPVLAALGMGLVAQPLAGADDRSP